MFAKLKTFSRISFIIIGWSISACEELIPEGPAEHSILDGPVPGLTTADQRRHLNGDIAFNDEVFTGETGLGPLFVAASCGSCHPGDGKGHPFVSFIRFGQADTLGNQYRHQGGPQLQHRALPGYHPETLPAGASHTSLIAPAVTGLGFLEAVPDSALLALADPEDADNDGISGRPNWISLAVYDQLRPQSVSSNGRYIGRFGKKAAVYSLLQQTVNAYNEDMGIASTFNPLDTYSGFDTDPEVSDQTVQDVVFYLQTLKAPVPRPDDGEIEAGKAVFEEIGCEGCHVPTLRTGPSLISALENKVFHPYTDLLLHDMGPGLDDGYTEGYALPGEWRTPPLWGLGLSRQSQGGRYFLLHDGRAASIEEAIELHGGEAEMSRLRYQELSKTDKAALIKFLESL